MLSPHRDRSRMGVRVTSGFVFHMLLCQISAEKKGADVVNHRMLHMQNLSFDSCPFPM